MITQDCRVELNFKWVLLENLAILKKCYSKEKSEILHVLIPNYIYVLSYIIYVIRYSE